MIERIKNFLADLPEYIGKNFRELLIYSAIALFFFLSSLYLMFPYENIVSGFIKNIEKQYLVKLKIGSIAPRLPVGLTFERVEISGRRLTNDKPVNIDRLKIKIEVASLLLYPFTRALTCDFGAVVNKGTADGTIRMSKNSIDFGLKTEALSLGSLSPLAEGLGLTIGGTVDSNLIMSSESKGNQSPGFLNSRGEISVKSSSLSLGASPVQEDFESSGSNSLLTFLSIMPLSFTKLEAKAVMQDGILKINELDLEREGLTGKINGTVKLESDFVKSYLDLTLNFKLAENEKFLKPLLMLSGQNIGCPLNPDGSVACRLKGEAGQLVQPSPF